MPSATHPRPAGRGHERSREPELRRTWRSRVAMESLAKPVDVRTLSALPCA